MATETPKRCPLDQIELFHIKHVVDDWAHLVDRLDINGAYVVGYDYGAIVIHKFVRKYRDRVIKAVIFNSIVPDFASRYLDASPYIFVS